MFNLSSTSTAAIIAAISLTAAATAGIDNATERAADVPHIGDQPKGHQDVGTTGGPLGDQGGAGETPGLGIKAHRTAGDGTSSGAGIGDERPPGTGQGVAGTDGGPLGNEFEKSTGEAPGLGDAPRGEKTHPGGESSGAGIGDVPPPGIGQGVEGTDGGPLGNEFEKRITLDPPGLGDGGGDAVNFDIDGNGRIDFMDLVELLSAWGADRGPADLTGDHVVDIRDLVLFLANMPAPVIVPDRDGATGIEVPTERDYRRPDGRRVIDFGQERAKG